MNRTSRLARAGWGAHPVLSLLVATVWLLMQESLVVPQLITAALLGLLVPRLFHRFIGPRVRLRRAGLLLRFIVLVLWDILISNLTVARIVLTPGSNPKPAWVRVPLETQNHTAIVMLATIITATPGTVSCIVDEERREILVHALDCDDPEAMAGQIKQRYEAPLKEILG